MRYLIVSLVTLITFAIIGCGGGGGSSNANSHDVVKAMGSVGENGANYTFKGFINISWQDPVLDGTISLSNFKLRVNNNDYPIGYSTSANIPLDPTSHISMVNSVSVPYAFLATLPFSKKSRACNILFDYKLGGKTFDSQIPCELPAVSTNKDGDDGQEGNGSVTIDRIDSSEKTPYTSQSIHFAGQVKKDGKAVKNATIDYALLTPTYVQSPLQTIKTDKNGLFSLNLKTNQNPLQEERIIAIVFNYEGVSHLWKVTQAASPKAAEFKIASITKQTSTSKIGGTLTYIGTLKSGDTGVANQPIKYTVTPSNASSVSSSSIPTDEFGNFTLQLPVSTNNTGSDRDIKVVFTYKGANDVWSINQSSQEETNSYTIDIPVIQDIPSIGGTYSYIGTLRDNKNTPVAGKSVNFSILASDFITSVPQGIITTNDNGNFQLDITFNKNIFGSDRKIPVVFSYANAVKAIDITQKFSKTSYTIKPVFSQSSAPRSSTIVKFIGILDSDNYSVNGKTINYSVIPSNAVTTANGTIQTDPNGNFDLDLTLTENSTGGDRDISVVFKVEDVSHTWAIKQSSQNDTTEFSIKFPSNPKVTANGGTFIYEGILTNKKTNLPVSGKNVSYQILTPDYIDGTALNGTITTQSNGTFKLPITFARNINGSDRTISVVFVYQNTSYPLEITQSGEALVSPYIFTKYYEEVRAFSNGGTLHYFGKLTNQGEPLGNTVIDYTISPTEVEGNVTTDAEGNFMATVTLNPLIGNRNYEVGVVFNYLDQSEVWKIVQEPLKPTYKIELSELPKIPQGGGTFPITGIVTYAQDNSFVPDGTISYSIINSNMFTTTSATANIVNGHFNLDLVITANDANNSRNGGIAFTYQNILKSVPIEQDGNNTN